MSTQLEWSKEAYSNSISSRCWWYTLYDEGWFDGVGIAVDQELKEIVEMEAVLRPIPDWAREIVEVWINFLPACGHYLFPLPLLEIVGAIGAESAEGPRHACYSVDRDRKRAMADYCLCMDAWLAGAPPEAVVAELQTFGARQVDWKAICGSMWEVLGKHDETKDLLVEHYLHALRHAIKSSTPADHTAGEFGRDQYVGDYTISPEDGVGRFLQGSSRRIQNIAARLSRLCPDWQKFSAVDDEHWWLCAPKAFRFLERDLWAIGKGHPVERDAEVPGFLRCEDTCPNPRQAALHYGSFRDALISWLHQEQPGASEMADEVHSRLGASTPMKRWLVRLLLKKLTHLEQNQEFNWLVKDGITAESVG